MNRRVSSVCLRTGILVLATTGLWISGQMVKQDAGLWKTENQARGLFAFVCRASRGIGFDCHDTGTSRWAEIKLPLPVFAIRPLVTLRQVSIPLSFLGLAYFVFIVAWYTFIGPPRLYGPKWHKVPIIVGLCAASLSILYLAAMAFGMAPRCAWCLIVHVINLVTVGAMYRLHPNTRIPGLAEATVVSLPETMAAITITSREAISTIAFSLIIIAGLWTYRNERLALQDRIDALSGYKALVTTLQEDPDFLLREHFAQPRYDIPVRSNEPAGGNQPELVIFTDLQCGACDCRWRWLREHVGDTFKDGLMIRVRHFPLCRDCNPLVKDTQHRDACEAARAVEAARISGGDKAFWRMHDLILANPKKLNEHVFRTFAVQIGLDPDRFVRDMASDTVRRIVQSDITLAEKLGVTATPTLFLNGRRITAMCQTPRLWDAVAKRRLQPPERPSASAKHSDSLAATGEPCPGI